MECSTERVNSGGKKGLEKKRLGNKSLMEYRKDRVH